MTLDPDIESAKLTDCHDIAEILLKEEFNLYTIFVSKVFFISNNFVFILF